MARLRRGRFKLTPIFVGRFRGDQAVGATVEGSRAAPLIPFLVEPCAGNLLAAAVLVDGVHGIGIHIHLVG